MSQEKLKSAFNNFRSMLDAHLESHDTHKDVFNQLIEAHRTTEQKIILRYLRARKLSVPEAFKLLTDTLEWREERKIHEITHEKVMHIKELKGSYICGFSNKGDAVCYIIPGAYNPYSLDDRVNYLIHLMEEGCKRSLTKKMIWVMDFSQYAKRSKDPDSKKLAFQSIKVLQHHYPETLRSLFVVDAPWFFRVLWYILKPFIDPVTKQKVHFISRKDSDIILEQVPSDMLDKNFGGTLEVTDEMKINWDLIEKVLDNQEWLKVKENILLEEQKLAEDLVDTEKHE